MTDSTDAIDAAIQSAESLFASLLDRVPSAPARLCSPDHDLMDPENSLVPSMPLSPEGSIATIGAASLGPAHLTAHSHAVYDDLDPRESLSALVSRSSSASLPESPSYDMLYKLLKERENDLELAANIGRMLLKRNDLLESDLGIIMDHRQALEQQVAQLHHTVSQKEELLRLYARDASERDQAETETTEDKPEWVVALTEECRELRESNFTLKMEADQLRKETVDIKTKERELVQQCLEQFSEAKRTLSEMRERSEESYQENQSLLNKLEEFDSLYNQELTRRQQLTEEGDLLKEQLVEAHDTVSQLTNEVSMLNEHFNETSVLLKEANDEITALKEISVQPSSPADNGEGPQVEQHESIVREIEEALRKEIHAASMLTERPRSPNHYARQRTMVVMETVRAATLATARRLERLATEAKLNNSDDVLKPVAASSPNEPPTNRYVRTTATPTRPSPLTQATPPSPIRSGSSSPVSLPDDLVRYRNQTYVPPQKLQIVKPMEGSVTLLKWKLLATPQLGGAKSFFSDASRPGVHLKKWSASGIVDKRTELTTQPYDQQKSVSAFELRDFNTTYPPARSTGSRRGRGTRLVEATPTRTERPSPIATNVQTKRSEDKDQSSQSTSLLGQVGSFLGSGWSKLRGGAKDEPVQPPPSHNEQIDSGLGGLL